MSRSKHNGCGATCGVCKPHKKWKSNSPMNDRPSVRRRKQVAEPNVETLSSVDVKREVDAMPEGCKGPCCGGVE